MSTFRMPSVGEFVRVIDPLHPRHNRTGIVVDVTDVGGAAVIVRFSAQRKYRFPIADVVPVMGGVR